ncbi:MAG TPA: hypothetical protein PLF71_01295 [bacterium]|nr:MAG: hypothetical protein BWY14_00523 [Parcubacteria group bacterium ADurb.Bin192]HPN14738.1 hypothetical protein [bacterium]
MSKNRRGAVKLSDLQAGEQTFEALGISPAERSEEGLKTPESSPQGPETVEQVYQGLTDMTEADKGEIAGVVEVVKGAGPEAEAEAQASGEQALTELSGAESQAQASIREVVGEPGAEAEPSPQALEGEARVGGMTREQISDTLDKLQKRRRSLRQSDIRAQASRVLKTYYTQHPGLGKSRTQEERDLEKDFNDVQKWQKEIEDLDVSINELQAKLKSFPSVQSEKIPATETAPPPSAKVSATEKSGAQSLESVSTEAEPQVTEQDLEEQLKKLDLKIENYENRYGNGKNPEKYALLMADLQNRRAGLQGRLDALRGQVSDTSIEYGLTEFSPEEMQTMREEVANKDELPESSEEMVIERTAHSKPDVLAPDTIGEADTLAGAGEEVAAVPATLKTPSDAVYETAGVTNEAQGFDVETTLSAEELAAERDQKDLQYRLKELEEAGPDKWSLAYTGRGRDWSKEQWEKLSHEKKVGEDKSEKQQLFDIYNNLLRGDIRVGGLVSDLKQVKAQINRQEQGARSTSGSLVMSMQEQMQEAQAQASNLELQTLKARESEILRELRKLDELKKQETAKEKVLFDQTNDLIHVSGTGELPEPASVEKTDTLPAAPYYMDAAAAGRPSAPESTGTVRMESADAAIMAAAVAAEAARGSSSHEVAPTLIDRPDTISETPAEREFFHGAKKPEEEAVAGKRPGMVRRAAGYAGYGLAGAGLTVLGYGAYGAFKLFQWTTWKAPMKLFKFLMEASADWGGYFKKKWQALQDFADKPVNDENKERK